MGVGIKEKSGIGSDRKGCFFQMIKIKIYAVLAGSENMGFGIFDTHGLLITSVEGFNIKQDGRSPVC
jgi:hypothetical protein